MTREELIAALEAATGPSRELDRLIHFHVVHPWLAEKCVKWVPEAFGEDGDFLWWDETQLAAKKEGYSDAYLPYTASLDAALTLVPEHHFWCLTMRGEKRGGFDACCLPEGTHMEWHTGATPAIALCISALKARA